MYFILTTFGQTWVDNNPSTAPVLTSYRLGDSFNYTPTSGQTAMTGNTVYTGVPSAPIVVAPSVVRYLINMDNTVGDFDFGEASLWMGASMFAIGVSASLLSKTEIAPNVPGNNLTIDAYLTMLGSSYDIYSEVSNSSNPYQIPKISTVEALPLPNGSSSNLYISASPTADSGSVLATAYEGRWSISSYELEAASGFVTSANGATVSFANYATSAGDIVLTEIGEYLLQMVTGHLAGLVRIVNVLPASGPATIVLNTAFLPAPSAGDKFVLLRRGSGTLSVGGSSGTYQGALLNTQGNLIPAGTTMMTEAEATAAISAATNNIPATRLTGLSTQVALQASGNNAYEPLTDVFGVPLGRVLPN